MVCVHSLSREFLKEWLATYLRKILFLQTSTEEMSTQQNT
jgi:hypothetical protein